MNVRNRKALRCVIVLLWLFTLARLIRAIFNPELIDLFHMLNWSYALVEGLDPFDHSHHLWHDFGRVTPPVFPPVAIFMIPLMKMNVLSAQYLFIVLSEVMGLTCMWLALKLCGIRPSFNLREADRQSFYTALCFLLFMTSRPVITGIRLGQLSIAVTLCVLISLRTYPMISRSIALGLGTVLKYSLSPFFMLYLFIIGQRKLVVLSFLLFLLFSIIAPALFNHDLIDLYSRYFEGLQLFFRDNEIGGYDTFSGCTSACHTLIHLDFFKSHALSLSLRAILLLLFLILMIQQAKRERTSLNVLLATASLTLISIYHRNHDLSLALVFLPIFTLRQFESRYWFRALCSSLFMLYYWVPQDLMLISSKYLGGLIGENDWIFLSPQGRAPLEAIMTTLLCIWSIAVSIKLRFWETPLTELQELR